MLKGLLDRGDIFRGVRPFLSNSLSLLLDKPNKLAPLYIVWSNTAKCNQGCLTCAILDERAAGGELTPEECVDIAGQIGQSRTWAVTLTGGEPLLRQDIFDVIAVLKKNKKLVNISTNGILLDRYIDRIISSGVDSVCISLDSHIPQINDFIRQSPGALERVSLGLKRLKYARGRRRHPQLSIRCVINRLNYKTLDDFILFSQKQGIRNIIFQPIQNSGPHKIRDEQLLFQPGDYADLKATLNTLLNRHRFMRNYFYRHMADFVFFPERFLQGKGYRCLDNSAYLLFIGSSGEVSLCPGRPSLVIGNLKQSKVLDIWRSESNYKAQRMLRGSQDCICWTIQKLFNHYLNSFYRPLCKKAR